MKQNNQAECKPSIQMGKMAGNGSGMVLLTAPPVSFFEGGRGRYFGYLINIS